METNKGKGKAPAAKSRDGKIAVFDKNDTCWNICEEENGQKTYTSLYKVIRGAEISAEEAIRLYQGEDLDVDAVKRGSGEVYHITLAIRDVSTDPKEVNGVTYENRMAVVGSALAKKNDQGELTGWKVDGVDFFSRVGPKSNPVYLTAGDCMVLLDGQEFERNGFKVSLSAVEEVEKEGKQYRHAKVSCRSLQEKEEQKEAEDDQESVRQRR